MDHAVIRNPSVCTVRELEAEITELAGHLNAATHRWLTLIAEFDSRKGWSDSATQSCAHWLNWKCGIDLGAARERVRVAHALGELPRISASMARGELSYSKARALTRVADSGSEEYFLSIALHGTAHHVETLVRHYRRAQEAAELSSSERQQAGRALTCFFDDDGSLVLKARLPAETGALLLKALAIAVEASPPADVSAETSVRPTLGARRADALGVLAESFLKTGPAALSGGERHQIVVHVDSATLRERTAGRSELEDGPAVAAETVRRLACDASIVTLVENEHGEPLNIGRKTRSIPPAIRRALNARDRGCRFPSCPNKRYVDGHHIHHWANGGETKLSNLLTLCRFHHRQVHEGCAQIQVLDDGALRFLAANGRAVEVPGRTALAPSGDWTRLVAEHRRQSLTIDQETATTLWRGESMDYGLAIEVLLRQSQRTRDVSAETSDPPP